MTNITNEVAHFLGFSWEVDPSTRDILGWIGIFSAFGLFLSPMKDIWGSNGVYALKSTHRIATSLPYYASFANCFIWSFYAYYHKPEWLLQPFLINVFCSICNFSYLACFLYFSRNRRREFIYLFGTVFMFFFAMAAWAITGEEEAVGTTAAGVNIVMYYAPLDAVRDIVATKSVSTTPFLPMLFTLISSCCWLAYGVYIVNYPVIIPNVCGLFLGIVQVSIYGYYARRVSSSEYRELVAQDDDLEEPLE